MSDSYPPLRVAFVCLGNICRSPLAEALFRHHVERLGASERFVVRSMGTGGWHVGDRADARTEAEAARRGVDLSAHRGAQFTAADFDRYDRIFAMDAANLRDLRRLAPSEQHADKVERIRAYDPAPGNGDVPDPYYGGPAGFAHVHDLLDRTTAALAERLVSGD